MIDDRIFRENGKFKKGHRGINQHTKPQPPPDPSTPPSDADTDFDAAILAAASSFGRPGSKQKVGLAGYCASLRDTRPQDFAMLVAKATARRTFAEQSRAAAIPITVAIVPCLENYFIPSEEARALWAASTGEGPVLVIDNDPDNNDPPTPTDDTDTDPDDLFSDDTDPDDAG